MADQFYATAVISAPSKAALDAAMSPILGALPFTTDETATRVVAFSWTQDAMSVLDAVQATLDSRKLDHWDKIELTAEIARLDTWESCLAKFAEWDLAYDDGELVDLREAAA